MDRESYGAIAAVAKDVADLLLAKLGSEGTTIMQMNREAGWQTVFHAHIHVIPRWRGDGLLKPWEIAPTNEAELQVIQQLLTK